MIIQDIDSTMTFEDVTELPGSMVSNEQLCRVYNRYYWTALNCKDCDVLEVACGSGVGVGFVDQYAKTITAGDFSNEVLEYARKHYGSRFDFHQFDAQEIPFENDSFDVVVIHEALYYVPDAQKFVSEARRVLRKGGRLLVTNSNKDLFDFNPSPHSYVYHGVVELTKLLADQGFETKFWGSQPVSDAGLVQKLTRPLKRLAVWSGLMPKTMRSKEFLKRLIFGKLVQLPAEVSQDMAKVEQLKPLTSGEPCRTHKIIYCIAEICH